LRENGPEKSGPGVGWRNWALILVLLVVPGALYAAVPVVVFLPLTTAQKIVAASGLVIAAEVVFWGAAFFVGGAVISRYRRLFDPRSWSRRE